MRAIFKCRLCGERILADKLPEDEAMCIMFSHKCASGDVAWADFQGWEAEE